MRGLSAFQIKGPARLLALFEDGNAHAVEGAPHEDRGDQEEDQRPDVGGDRVSTITGLMNFIGQSGSFLMSIVFGKIVDLTHNYEAPQFLMTALLFIGGICWFGIDASKKIIGGPIPSTVIPSLHKI